MIAPLVLLLRPIFIFISAQAQSTVPVVNLNTFSPGTTWTWEYREGERFYSSERYTVVSNQNGDIWIEMSTRLENETTYRPHHRQHVVLEACLNSYKNAVTKTPWNLEMFYLNQGRWERVDPGTTLAFEEKFNCNPHVYSSYGAGYRTVFTETPRGKLFEQKRWGRLDGSRFFMNGEFAGIAASKRFAKPKGDEYSFSFEEQKVEH